MPINPSHQFGASYLDYSKEKSGFQVNMGPITVGTLAGFLTQMDTFLDAVQALSLGALQETFWTGDITRYSGAPPTDVNAQRERKWRVDYEDTTTLAKYHFEIPIALVTGQLITNTDQANLATTEWAALVAAAEATLKSPEGNAINILGAQLVGRNL